MRHFDNAYVLLSLTTLFWAGNAIAGQLAVNRVSPMAVVFLRWTIVSIGLIVYFHKPLRQHWPLLKQHKLFLISMSVLGYTAFNALFYVASHRTSAVNIGILQGSIPIVVFLGAYLAFKTLTSRLQMIGTIVTLVGVATVTTRGQLDTLLGLEFASGDLIMLAACACYATYTLMLQKRPPVPGIVLFTLLALIACAASVPLVIVESSAGYLVWPQTATAWAIVLFIALFPSLLSQLFFMRGVESLGPGRAGIFVNLVPVFTAILAVVILAEPFRAYHAAALALVLFGIWLAERGRVYA